MQAPGKINLFLKVTGRRSDGFHDLLTLFVPVAAPADTLDVDWNAAPGVGLDCSAPGVPGGVENLAGLAALRYAERSGIAPAWHIRLDKKIPVAAGMGGGSSDAGTLLRNLENRFGALGEARLAALALELGSDVSFFLNPAPAVARGRGEALAMLDFTLPELPLLLVNPRFPVSARWAYTHLLTERIGAGDEALERLLAVLRSGDLEAIGCSFHNDLAFALFRKFPLLAMLRDAMRECGALGVEISGSGPTLFALCRDVAHRTLLRTALERDFAVDCFEAGVRS